MLILGILGISACLVLCAHFVLLPVSTDSSFDLSNSMASRFYIHPPELRSFQVISKSILLVNSNT